MRTTINRLALLGALVAVPALAQTTPPAGNTTTRPGATTSPDATTGTAATDRGAATSGQPAARIDAGPRTAENPVPGANSFTEGQAKSRLEAAGFTDISGLQKDDQGIWRGQAKHAGQQVAVALDYQGNVTPPR
jgi:hypothetical protein